MFFGSEKHKHAQWIKLFVFLLLLGGAFAYGNAVIDAREAISGNGGNGPGETPSDDENDSSDTSLGGAAAESVTAQQIQAIPDLIAYYNFDSDFRDDSQNNNDAREEGPGSVSFVPGKRNSGVRFNGQSHLQAAGNPVDVHSMSISLWFRLDDDDAKDQMKLVMRDMEGANPRIFQLQVYNKEKNAGDAQIRFNAETDSVAVWDIGVRTNTTRLRVDVWYHLVVTVKEEENGVHGEAEVWINGTRQELLVEGSRPTRTATFRGRLQTNPSVPLFIGTPEKEQHVLDGVVDELRLYNRPLTPREIKLLHKYDAP
ncbi:MAG: hypothetical protein DHS20C16_36320 [Phycisphaerae bacterium]|nr:MAG: hypothetical protein DHS20C16_36320 [Phycisphaerae bacterium]